MTGGTFVSYAQNFEDVMLWRALREVPKGFYIDVGAYSPMTDSVTQAFYERGWSGVNIEPSPEAQLELKALRPRDINLAVALSDAPGVTTMYFVSESGLSTLDGTEAERHRMAGRDVKMGLVQVETLARIWAEHVPDGQAVHFLKIDVEGFERQVVAGNDWTTNRPWIVVVEATRPNTRESTHQQWEGTLLRASYGFAYADGLNRFYVASEYQSLAVAFSAPPNVFDGFIRAPESEAVRRAEQAAAELAAMRRSRSWRYTEPARRAARAGRGLFARVRQIRRPT